MLSSICDSKEQKYQVQWEPHSFFGGACYVCKASFTLVQRRVHCRMCGHIVCDKLPCLHTMLIPVPGSKHPKTVCNPCANDYYDEVRDGCGSPMSAGAMSEASSRMRNSILRKVHQATAATSAGKSAFKQSWKEVGSDQDLLDSSSSSRREMYRSMESAGLRSLVLTSEHSKDNSGASPRTSEERRSASPQNWRRRRSLSAPPPGSQTAPGAPTIPEEGPVANHAAAELRAAEAPARFRDGGSASPPPGRRRNSARKDDPSVVMCPCCSAKISSEWVNVQREGERMTIRVHQACFVCHIDNAPIQGEYFDTEHGWVCEAHYTEFYCETCEGCNSKITEDDSVEVNGSFYHTHCFICDCCQKPLYSPDSESARFTFREHAGQIFCSMCYDGHFSDKCHDCGFPVLATLGNGIKALGFKYHQECFVCTWCRVPFMQVEERAFGVVEGFPYCKEHIQDALRAVREAGSESEPDSEPSLTALPCSKFPASQPLRSLTPQLRGRCLSKGIEAVLTEGSLEPAAGTDSQSYSPGMSRTMIGKSPKPYREKRLIPNGLKIDGTYQSVFGFEAVAPAAFRMIRSSCFGITEEEYELSMCSSPMTGGAQGEGKSGQLFFFSWNKKFIAKTLDSVEVPFFRKCLQDYHNHFLDQEEDGSCTRSLLPRFLGLYGMKFDNERIMYLVIMTNVFPVEARFSETYDLKGVLGANREVTAEQREQGVKTLKDRNFISIWDAMPLGASKKERLMKQLRKDIDFLQEHDLIDYSLLLGVTDCSSCSTRPRSDPGAQWPSPEGLGICLEAPGDAAGKVVFMGVIDILQKFTFKKDVEGRLKMMRHALLHFHKRDSVVTTANAVSAVCPSMYAQRFVDFFDQRLA